MGPIQNASNFLIHSFIDLYLMILLLRLFFQYLRVDYYNPLSQFIVRATSPIVVPLRRKIPGFWGIDFATLIVILSLNLFKIILITLISAHQLPAPLGLIIWSLGDLFALTIKLFFYAILISVIFSWIAPLSHSPFVTVLYRLTEPFLHRARRMIPPVAGLDMSPILVLIFLQLMIILFADPLMQKGFQLAIH